MGIRRILSRHNLSPAECSRHITSYTLTDTPLESSCESLHKSCSQEEILSQYRSIDGTCNHKNDGTQGSAFTAYKRLLHPEYLDGVQEPRRAVSKKQLPSARLVSGRLGKSKRLDDSNSDLTLAMMLWSEFVEHDLSQTVTNKMGIYKVCVEFFFLLMGFLQSTQIKPSSVAPLVVIACRHDTFTPSAPQFPYLMMTTTTQNTIWIV
jgi:hypothetical protein